MFCFKTIVGCPPYLWCLRLLIQHNQRTKFMSRVKTQGIAWRAGNNIQQQESFEIASNLVRSHNSYVSVLKSHDNESTSRRHFKLSSSNRLIPFWIFFILILVFFFNMHPRYVACRSLVFLCQEKNNVKRTRVLELMLQYARLCIDTIF